VVCIPLKLKHLYLILVATNLLPQWGRHEALPHEERVEAVSPFNGILTKFWVSGAD